jgi:superfamily II DNA/RNA helicase
MPFSKLGLAPSLCTPLARMGYGQPTPVQSESIPFVLSGSDLLARAQTGTGKTAAFGLPMIERLFMRGRTGRIRSPRGLVLVPTRELALQVRRALATYGAPVQLRVLPIFGGVPMGPQVQALKQGTDIVVATPGRLIDHIQRRTLDLSAIEILTLDEADRMLDMGFLPSLRRVIPALPRARQTLLFSATLSTEVVRLSAEFTRDPVRVDVSEGQVVAPTVTHRVHPVASDRKRDLLKHILTQAPAGQTLVFCKTKRGGHTRQQESGRTQPRSGRLQGRPGDGAGGYRHRRTRPRHRATSARGQLRPAARRRRLHPSRRTDGAGRACRARDLARDSGGTVAVARHPAAAADTDRAGRCRGIRIDEHDGRRRSSAAEPPSPWQVPDVVAAGVASPAARPHPVEFRL